MKRTNSRICRMTLRISISCLKTVRSWITSMEKEEEGRRVGPGKACGLDMRPHLGLERPVRILEREKQG